MVWGQGDPIAVPAMVYGLVSRRPATTVTWLETGHWPMVEQPGQFADAVLAALAEDAQITLQSDGTTSIAAARWLRTPMGLPDPSSLRVR